MNHGIGGEIALITAIALLFWLAGLRGSAMSNMTETSMINGIVSAENGGAAGRTLSVTYEGDKSFRITVPSSALVAVGKGVTPPM